MSTSSSSTLYKVLDFLLPRFDEPLQIVFFLIIFILVSLTVFLVQRHAHSKRWLSNWEGGEGGVAGGAVNHLDADHGSVNDISHAVSTGAERLADVMPSLLLIVGLLGTFLGVGLALNEASAVLSEAGNDASGNLGEGMSNLTDMMKNLGMKFKTSTWGIIGYLVMKSWSTWNGFEERRLRWSTRMMKTQLDARRRQQQTSADARHNELQKLFAQFLGYAQLTLENSSNIYGLLQKFVQSNERSLDAMRDSSTKMSSAAESISRSANLLGNSSKELGNTIEDFGGGVEDVLNGVKNDLKSAIDEFNTSTATNMNGIAGNMKAATDGISASLSTMRSALGEAIDKMNREFSENLKGMEESQRCVANNINMAINGLSGNVEKALEHVSNAMAKQAEAQNVFSVTSQLLHDNIKLSTYSIDKVAVGIESGLAKVAQSNLLTRGLDKKYESVGDMATRQLEAIEKLIAALDRLGGSGSLDDSEDSAPSRLK